MLPNIQPEPWRVKVVRLAVPRRVSTHTRLEYVTDVTTRLLREPAALRGVRITRQARLLRHFTAQFEHL
jgi:tyrosine phenol-lyase